jgi:hypothetical protein
MPAKGTRKLTDKQKVEIVVTKQLKPRGTSTNVKLAAALDVKPNTIAKTKYETLTPTQKELYEKTIANLKYDSADLTANSIKKANELVALAETTKDLTGVVAAGKFAHDVYRLETGQSTQNTGITDPPDHKCEKFLADILACRTEDGRSPTLEQGYQALMWAEIDVSKEVREQFIEVHRRKWLGGGTG